MTLTLILVALVITPIGMIYAKERARRVTENMRWRSIQLLAFAGLIIVGTICLHTFRLPKLNSVKLPKPVVTTTQPPSFGKTVDNSVVYSTIPYIKPVK